MKDNLFKINHFGITVGDLERTRSFYEKLGFEYAGKLTKEDGSDVLDYPCYEELTGVPGCSFKIMMMEGYGITLEFLQYVVPEEIVIDTKPYIRGTGHLCIECTDPIKAYEDLKNSGVEMLGKKAVCIDGGTHTGVYAYYFKDPDGYILEIKKEA